jgi:hypothetical protein
VVVVNYNTRDLISYLVFSLCRVLPHGAVGEIVVVDNRSSDDSLLYLCALHEAGLITLVQNRGAPYHGPGLNVGISHVAGRTAHQVPERIWVLDSDTIILRPEVVTAVSDAMTAANAVLAGEINEDHYLPGGLANFASAIITPDVVWRRPFPPFREAGEVGVAMMRAVRAAGLSVVDFPFFRDDYVLHLGRGTLKQIASTNDDKNRYWEWAQDNRSFHFDSNPRGPALFAAFLDAFRAEIATSSPDDLVEACQKQDRLGPIADRSH